MGSHAPPPGSAWAVTVWRGLRAPALGYRDFRFLWLATLFNSIGTLGEQVVLGWLTLELTNSPFMVGVALGLRMAPMLLLGALGGVVADRVNRSRFVMLLNLATGVTTATLGTLILLHAVQLWHILLLTFAGGSLRAFYQASRTSFAYDIVGPSNIMNAMAFMALAMRVGGLAGSLLAGGFTSRWGAGEAYLALAVGYVLGAISLLPVRSAGQAAPTARTSLAQNLAEYVREVRRNRDLLLLAVLTSAAEVLGFSYQVLLPSLARDVLKVGAGGLGLMSAFRSIGGMLATMVVAAMGEVQRKGALFLLALHLFAGCVVLLAFAPSYLLALAALTVINATGGLVDIMSQSLMQLSVSNELRGRAMGSWVLAIGTGPLGQLQIGALGSLLGLTFALTFNGLALMAMAAVAATFFPRLRRL